MNWQEVCDDPVLRDLPYKIELNRWGKIEMSPHRKEHAVMQSALNRLFNLHLPDWIIAVECAVDTTEGVKVADVAAMSPQRWDSLGPAPSCSIAPEICVEVVSLGNSPAEMEAKGKLYFAAGAREFWLCDESGAVRFYNASGEINRSEVCPQFPQQVPVRRR